MQAQSPRYITKFNNGYHKVFDTLNYTDYALCYLLKDAVEMTARLNTKAK